MAASTTELLANDTLMLMLSLPKTWIPRLVLIRQRNDKDHYGEVLCPPVEGVREVAFTLIQAFKSLSQERGMLDFKRTTEAAS